MSANERVWMDVVCVETNEKLQTVDVTSWNWRDYADTFRALETGGFDVHIRREVKS